jgi:hypothetical protein
VTGTTLLVRVEALRADPVTGRAGGGPEGTFRTALGTGGSGSRTHGVVTEKRCVTTRQLGASLVVQ